MSYRRPHNSGGSRGQRSGASGGGEDMDLDEDAAGRRRDGERSGQQHQHQQQGSCRTGDLRRTTSVDAHALGDKWRQAYLEVAAAAGVSIPSGGGPSKDAVLGAIKRLRQSDEQLQAQRQQLAALQVQVSHLVVENLELRRELGSGWAVADPSISQVRHLVLDPAIQQEFTRLRRELEEHKETIKQLQDDNTILRWEPESAVGRLLVNKVKALTKENAEYGEQARAGPGAVAGALLALERRHGSELRKAAVEAAHHCSLLEEENAELDMLRFAQQRQIQELQALKPPKPAGGSGPRGSNHDSRGRSSGGGGGAATPR